jgi:hypothetical protein
MTSTEQAELDKLLRDKRTLERKIHSALAAIDRKRFPPMPDNEVAASNPTPVSDGERVYWACGGGMKGPGASVVACYDFDGRRIWSYHEAFGAAEHGLHTSPVLVDGKLIYGAHKWLVAFDAATGAIAWRQHLPSYHEFCGSSPQVVRLGGENAILTPHTFLYRASDGALLAGNALQTFGDLTPIAENGVLYYPNKFKRWSDDNVAFVALQLPTNAVEKSTLKPLWELKWEDTHVPLRGVSYFVASPLYANGIVYAIDMSGGLIALDPATQKTVFRRWLDWYNRYDRFLYGVAASPTLGGRNVFFVDDAGYTIILKPGPVYAEAGRNILENVHLSSESGNPCKQEAFYTAPIFDGRRMYLKGEEYLYCIGEK